MNDFPRIGDATVVRHDDGTRTVTSAAEVIRVSAELLTQLHDDRDIIEADGTLRLDTAGEYRYRYLRSETPHVLLYKRVTDA